MGTKERLMGVIGRAIFTWQLTDGSPDFVNTMDMLVLLARRWETKVIAPAANLPGYWNTDEATSFDLHGLTANATTTKCPFWLAPGPPARLYPQAGPASAGNPTWHLEVRELTPKQLSLALWMPFPPEGGLRHCLTYNLMLVGSPAAK